MDIRSIIFGLFFVASLVSTPATLAQESSVDKLVERWLALEVQSGQLQSAWDERKIILDQQARLLEEEAAALREVIESHRSSATETDQERARVLAQQNKLEQQQARLEEQLELAVHRLSANIRRLPPPLRDDWASKLPRLENTEVSLSNRLDGVLQLLAQLHEFEQRVAIHSGNIRQREDGPEILVTQVYLGAARGWYVSADGSHYGYGQALPEGWRWWHGEAAESQLGQALDPGEISALIAVVQNPDKAALTPMPISAEVEVSSR